MAASIFNARLTKAKFDAAYFRGKNYFEEDGTQNCLVFQPVYKYFEKTGDKVSSWK